MHADPDLALLGAYLDGEVPSDQAAEIQEHLGSCPRCATEIAELVQMKRGLRAARSHFVPSSEFRRTMQKQIAAPAPRSWWMRLVPAMLALTFALVMFLGWTWYSHRSDALAEMADLHVNALASSNLVDVVSTDRHTVKPWFQGKIPFSFNLPELTGSDFSLLGGRLVYFHQRPGAQLIVALRQHKISVLIFQESPEIARDFPPATVVLHRNSYSMETWRSQELRFVIISDADPSGIDKLAQSFKDANR